ncbi:MAG: ABC transporter substrate-binding protein [Desulfarculales bacterium]|jgi:branched-chain amino acid transport system substrate-binding protein|nr:ABC transporter substrate-binding protein [Desulfarculales bacterium]
MRFLFQAAQAIRLPMPVLLAGIIFLGLMLKFPLPQALAADKEPIYFGVAGPFSGDNAEYGAMWKRGFDIALEEINSQGGLEGRPVEVVYEDTQSDPRQAASVAQKFSRDDRLLAVLGDFSTSATWSASPIYQRAGMVQLAFNPSHPDLTKPGDCVFQLAPDQTVQAEALAGAVIDILGAKRLAVLHLNTDFGKAVRDNIVKAAQSRGVEIVTTEAYLPTDKDFRAILAKVKALAPDAVALGSYYTDTALIMKQARDLDFKTQFVASSSVHSPALFTLGGDAVNGLITNSVFNFASPSPLLQEFTAKYSARYKENEPDTFATQAYDALRLLINAAAQSLKNGDLNRKSVRDELAATKDFPAVSQATITFNAKRQLAEPHLFPIIARDGHFLPYVKP